MIIVQFPKSIGGIGHYFAAQNISTEQDANHQNRISEKKTLFLT